MARKKNLIVENVPLKPQSLGKVYKKKNNVGRVIFIFIAFVLIIYYINDISLYINNLLGKKSATSIIDNQEKNKDKKKNNDNYQETIFYEYQDDLKIEYNNLKITNFKKENDNISFIINNTTNEVLSLKDKKYYFEFYNENKTLLKRIKVDIDSLSGNTSINKSVNISDEFTYLTFSEKNENYYPNVTLNNDELTCIKDNDTITYTFIQNKLTNVKHIISSNINNDEEYNKIQEYVNKYNTYNGISGTVNKEENGYNALIMINLKNVVDEINKYYFKNETLAKVVNFEMEAYGFDCN